MRSGSLFFLLCFPLCFQQGPERRVHEDYQFLLKLTFAGLQVHLAPYLLMLACCLWIWHAGTEAWPVDQGLWSTEADASDDSMPDDRTLSLPPWSRVSGMWRCNRCMYTAPDIYRIKRHQVTHTGERRYYCPICQARFTAKQSVKTHMRRHTGERPFACSRCPARFSRSQRLASHLQTCSAGAGFEQAA